MDEYLIPLEIPCVYYIPSVLTGAESQSYYKTLHQTVPWEKTPKINRWVALFEEEPANAYKYRDAPDSKSSKSISSCPTIATVKSRVEELYTAKTGRKVEFNTCLANMYETGDQRIGWHADREEIGRDTPIASVSLGATRSFLVRHKLHGVADRATVAMTSGSVMFMENVCQKEYLHSVPKETDVTEGRINLTFRCKKADTAGEAEHNERDQWLERITDGVAIDDRNDEELEELLKAELMGARSRDVVLFGDNMRTGIPLEEYGNVHYTVSCNIGTESQCAAEVQEVLGNDEMWEVIGRPWGIAGYVACISRESSGGDADAPSKLLELRSALNVMQYHDHFGLKDVALNQQVQDGEGHSTPKVDGEMLYAFFKKRLEANYDIIPSLAAASNGNTVTFRVSTERIGDHAFKSTDVEFEMGGACSEVYNHSKPKMTDHDVNIRIDIVGDRIIIGKQLNVKDLSRRHFLRFTNSVTIKTNIAYIMLRLANIPEGGLVVDPFCGSGTILLEALEITNKQVKCIGMDVNRRSARGASENALAEGYGADICEFHCTDARGLRRHVSDCLADAIVSNLPWGVRTGHNQSVNDLQQMYETFLRISWYVLKTGGRIVILVLRGLQLTRILRKLGGRFRIVKVQVVRTTNNLPCILVIEKIGRDLLHESVKKQLAYMSQFVNVSKEMYHAINYDKIDMAN